MVHDISFAAIFKVILICLLFLFLFSISDIILVVLAAVVIASAIEPATVWFAHHGVRRTFGVIIVYLSLALMFMGAVYYFLPQFFNEFKSLTDSISGYLNESASRPNIEGLEFLGGSDVLEEASSSAFTLREIVGSVSNIFSDASKGMIEIIHIAFGGVFSFILIIVLSFYFAVKENGVSNFLRIITPAKHETYVIDLWRRSERKIGLWMQGQLVLGVIVGVLIYVGLLIFGVNHAFLLALLMALFEIIPIFGPILAAIPGVLIATGQNGITFGLGIALLYLVVQQLESHIFYPLVVKKVVGISPIIVILALLVGAKLGGFLGALLSVPISAALLEYFYDKKKVRTGDSSSPATIL